MKYETLKLLNGQPEFIIKTRLENFWFQKVSDFNLENSHDTSYLTF